MIVDGDARSKQSVVGVTAPDHHCTSLGSEPIEFLRGNAVLDLTTDLLRHDRRVYMVESLGEFFDTCENLVERDLFAFSVALCYEHYHYERATPKCDDIYYATDIMSLDSDAGSATINDYLDSAVQDGNIGAATELLARGANPNFIGGSGVTLLNFAVWNQDVPMVKLLLKNGSDVNARNLEGRGTGHREVMFNPLQTVFTRAYDNRQQLDRNKAKHILFVLIYYGGALSTSTEDIARFIHENSGGNLGWANTSPEEIQEWVGDAAARRREQAILARLKAQGILEGGYRTKSKTLRKKRRHKHKTQRRLRRVRR